MTTIFKLTKSIDSDYLAAITLEGGVYFLETEEGELIGKKDFNNNINDTDGGSYVEENAILDLGFCYEYVPSSEEKKSGDKFKIRKFKKNSAVMSLSNKKFVEYLFKDQKMTLEKNLNNVWEKTLVLQNYRFGFFYWCWFLV